MRRIFMDNKLFIRGSDRQPGLILLCKRTGCIEGR
jgi:hypothetical protein